MSSWVTHLADVRDPDPASFVVAMDGVLGVGADLRAWDGTQPARARELLELYRQIRPVIQRGLVRRHGHPSQHAYAVQYTTGTPWCWTGCPVAEHRRPLTVELDLAHGGRWTSLRSRQELTGGEPSQRPAPQPPEPVEEQREWLWQQPSVLSERETVRPGEEFVDAGGVEECLPTVAGRPDHGDVWSRCWTGTPADARVQASGWELRRRVGVTDGVLTARYTVTGEPGRGLLHAVHGLFALSESARVVVPTGTPMRVQDVSEDVTWTAGPWPGESLDRCGPVDGTARLAVVATDAVQLVDGEDVLQLSWQLERGTGPVSLLLWRNLGGWPVERPYRSIGIEPLLGAATDVDAALPSQLARADAGGQLEWSVRIEALVAPRP